MATGLVKTCQAAVVIPNPLTATTFEELIDSIITFIFYLAIPIVVLMIIIGGAYFLTSGGNPERIRTAKNIILYTLIGFFIVLLAKGIISMLESLLGGS